MMGSIDEIKKLIKELIESDNENKKKSIATKIKRSCNIYLGEKRKDGLSEQFIQEYLQVFLDNYEDIKQYESINEVMESLLQDYNALLENIDEEKSKKISTKIFSTQVEILGNPGTSVEKMPLDYIKKIVEEKFDMENGINKDDVFEILKQVSNDMEHNSEDYQKFFEDIFVPIIDFEIENNTENLDNLKVVEILTELAKSYKYNEKYDKCKEICEKGLKLEQFKETEQYSELQREFEKINGAIELLNSNFEKLLDISEINSAEELIEIIKKYILEGEQIEYTFDNNFPTDRDVPGPKPNPNPNPDKIADQMTLEEKCIALFEFLNELKKENSNAKFTTPSKGKKNTTWDGYMLLPVSEAGFTILESFDGKNRGLYMVQNENIEKIERCRTKKEVKKEQGVTNANHSKERFEDYKSRLMRKYRELMNLETIKEKGEEDVSKNKNLEASRNKENLDDAEAIVEVDGSEEISNNQGDNKGERVENVEEYDLSNLSEEELLELNLSLQEEVDQLEIQTTEIDEETEKLEKEKNKQRLILEAKRKMAEKQRKQKEKEDKEKRLRALKKELGELSDKGKMKIN